MNHLTMWYDNLVRRGLIPDGVIRWVVRRMLHRRKYKKDPTGDEKEEYLQNYIEMLENSPIAIQVKLPNEQHYEVSTEFFQEVLGDYLKYSCGLWKDEYRLDREGINQSEHDMLQLTVERAGITDGMHILELGCGWGSLTLFMAAKFPKAKILAISNSRTQREYIEQQLVDRQLDNVQVITADVAVFEPPDKFKQVDRIVSVEMFEHMRNYQKLLMKLSAYLNNNGKLFVHLFTRKGVPYTFDIENEGDWMAKYFFAGGQMPSMELLRHFQDDLKIAQEWEVNGLHYQKTLRAWYYQMLSKKKRIYDIFKQDFPANETTRWWSYWKIFFIVCDELFGFEKGSEWIVSHILYEKTK